MIVSAITVVINTYIDKTIIVIVTNSSAGNNFFLFTGHMSFQIFILVGHLTNWTGHNLLTDNTLKKITQDVLVRCSVIVSDHNVKLAGHFQNLVGQCPMTDCYFQHCNSTNSFLLDRLFTFTFQQSQIIFSHTLSLYKAKLS